MKTHQSKSDKNWLMVFCGQRTDSTKAEKFRLTLNLQLFASEEKTEQPTSKKREKVRKEGQVARSNEVTTAFLLILMFFTIQIFSQEVKARFLEVFEKSVRLFYLEEINAQIAKALMWEVFKDMFLMVWPFLLVAVVVGVVTNLVQVGWQVTWKPLEPKLSNISPLKGLKRIFSARTLIELLKAIFKIALISILVYNTIKNYDNLAINLYQMDALSAYAVVFKIVLDLCIRIGWFFIIVAAIDYAYARFKFEKDIKMTKQEVKDEYKQSEGNPEIKGRIRQKMREVAMRRMMQDLPKADVVITNPTHFAVALRYDDSADAAPIVLAKGADLVAKNIREKAKEHGIEIIENKALARTLFYTVEIGDEIPPELYQAVAEILAFVYSLKNEGVIV